MHLRPGDAGIAFVQILRLRPFQLAHFRETMVRARVGPDGKVLQIVLGGIRIRRSGGTLAQPSGIGVGPSGLGELVQSLELIASLMVGPGGLGRVPTL